MSLSTSMRMVHGVHGLPEDGRAVPQPALTAGLPNGDEVVLGVTDRPDGGEALPAHLADLARGELEEGVGTVESDEGGCRPRRADDLPAAAGLPFSAQPFQSTFPVAWFCAETRKVRMTLPWAEKMERRPPEGSGAPVLKRRVVPGLKGLGVAKRKSATRTRTFFSTAGPGMIMPSPGL